MDELVEVLIPVNAEAAEKLAAPGRREAIGRLVSDMLTEGRLAEVLAEAIAAAKAEGRANGLTDQVVDEELEAWRAERKA